MAPGRADPLPHLDTPGRKRRGRNGLRQIDYHRTGRNYHRTVGTTTNPPRQEAGMKLFPPYPARPHRSGQARIRLEKKQVYLGKHGSPESWAEYQRRLEAWRRGQDEAPNLELAPPAEPARTVADLTAAFL